MCLQKKKDFVRWNVNKEIFLNCVFFVCVCFYWLYVWRTWRTEALWWVRLVRPWLTLCRLNFLWTLVKKRKSANCTEEPWDELGNNLNSQSDQTIAWKAPQKRKWVFIFLRISECFGQTQQSSTEVSHRTLSHIHWRTHPSRFCTRLKHQGVRVCFKSVLWGIPPVNVNNLLVPHLIAPPTHTLLCSRCYVAD